MLKFISVLTAIILLAACSKSSDNNGTDILTQGWVKLNSTVTREIYDVFFTNSTNGYYCGLDGIFRTTDAGNSWTNISTFANSNIGAFGETKACFVNQNEKIYITTDGISVQEAAPLLFVNDISFKDLFCSSNNICYASSGLYMWKSVDGGNSFDTLYNFQDTSNLNNDVNFVNDLTGWTNRSGRIFKTTDGGLTWANQFSGSTGAGLDFVSTSTGFMVSDRTAYKTTNGGATFTAIYSNLPETIIDIDFVSETTGYISFENKIYKTTDAGLTWTQVVALSYPQTFFEIHFIDATHGWACGTNGLLLRFN